MRRLTHLGAFTKESRDIINTNFLLAGFGTVGQVLYLDPANGYDNSAEPNNPDKRYKTLSAAYAAAVTGKNDVILLVGDGGTTATARVDAAFTWAKSATHLIGLTAPSRFSPRARIAPTGATTAFANFLTVSGSGCLFQNFSVWHGFNTGTTSAIALTISGSRNVFQGVHIAGMGDAASAGNAGSRHVKITGGENHFDHCVIGQDTVARGAANASLELASGAARNTFENCLFPFQTSAATVLGVKTAAAAALDRWTYFLNCSFENGILSTSTTMSGLATLAASSGGGLYMKDCARVGITDWGTDATSLAQIYVCGAGTGGTATDDVGRGAVAVAS